MPYANVPKAKWGAMDKCVTSVMADQGLSKDRAVAICHASVVEGVEAVRRDAFYIEAAVNRPLEGKAWDVTIIGPQEPDDLIEHGGHEYIRSRNDRIYSCRGLEESAPMWADTKVFDDHLTDDEFEERSGMRSPYREWLGSIVDPRWEAETHSLCGTFKVVDSRLAEKLKNAWDQGVLHTIGLSMDTFPIDRDTMIEGKRIPVIEGFKEIISVDLVAEPAAGGKFNRLLAAHRTQEQMMDEKDLRALIESVVADALANTTQEQDAEEMPPEEAAEEVLDAVEDVVEQIPAEADPVEAAQVVADVAQAVADEIAEEVEGEEEEEVPGVEALDRIQKLESRLMLSEKLASSKLPAALEAMVTAAFDNRTFEEVALDAFIKRAKEAQVSMDPTGRIVGVGGSRGVISVGMDARDKAEIEFMRLIAGNHKFRQLESIKDDYVRDRLPESYRNWTKAGKPAYGARRISEGVYSLLGGDPLSDQRAFEAVTTSGMSSIVKNTVNILLAADYASRHIWWESLVRTEDVDTIDTATLVRVYGLANLSIVSEGGPYTELEWADEEETAAFVKKGNYVGVTLETLLRDKVNVIRSLPERLASSWYNTLSALVAGVFTVNTATGPQLADTGALFNNSVTTGAGGHANLLTTALNFTNYGIARTAMMKQTDMVLGVGNRVLIQPKFLLVPVDLESMALRIRNTEFIPDSANNDINPYYQQFEVVVVPEWSDTDNWALMADPNEHPAIWQIFLRGRRVPELFTADSEVQGAMFTNDTLRYKVRMLTYRFSSSYECAPVSDFRPLHKNNKA